MLGKSQWMYQRCVISFKLHSSLLGSRVLYVLYELLKTSLHLIIHKIIKNS